MPSCFCPFSNLTFPPVSGIESLISLLPLLPWGEAPIPRRVADRRWGIWVRRVQKDQQGEGSQSPEGQGRGRREERGRGQWPGWLFPCWLISAGPRELMRAWLHGCRDPQVLTSLAISSCCLAPAPPASQGLCPCGFYCLGQVSNTALVSCLHCSEAQCFQTSSQNLMRHLPYLDL